MPLPPHVLIGTERTRRGSFDGGRSRAGCHRPLRGYTSMPWRSTAPRRKRRSRNPVHAGRCGYARLLGGQRDRERSRRDAQLRSSTRTSAGARRRHPAPGQPRLQRGAVRRVDARAISTGAPSRCSARTASSAGAPPRPSPRRRAASSMRRLRGVNVKEVRYLPEWTDTSRGTDLHGCRRARGGVRGRRPGSGREDPAGRAPRSGWRTLAVDLLPRVTAVNRPSQPSSSVGQSAGARRRLAFATRSHGDEPASKSRVSNVRQPSGASASREPDCACVRRTRSSISSRSAASAPSV